MLEQKIKANINSILPPDSLEIAESVFWDMTVGRWGMTLEDVGVTGGGGDLHHIVYDTTRYIKNDNENNKKKLYLAEAVHTITLIRDIGLQYNIHSLNHLPSTLCTFRHPT